MMMALLRRLSARGRSGAAVSAGAMIELGRVAGTGSQPRGAGGPWQGCWLHRSSARCST